MERWIPWEPKPVPDGNYELTEAVYDNKTGSGLPPLALAFSDAALGIRVMYPRSAYVDVFRICQVGTGTAALGKASPPDGLAHAVENSDFLAWMLEENGGTGYVEGTSHHAYRAGNALIDVLVRRLPAFETTPDSVPHPIGEPTSIPLKTAWRPWGIETLATIPKEHYELASITWRNGKLHIAIDGSDTRISILHDKAVAVRVSDESMRIGSYPNQSMLDHPGALAYRIGSSGFAGWAKDCFAGTDLRRVMPLCYSTCNDYVDVLAQDKPTVYLDHLPDDGNVDSTGAETDAR